MEDKNRLSILFEFATEGIFITNSNGEIILANPMAATQFGYGKDELNGKKIESLIPQRFSQYYKKPKPRSMSLGVELFAGRKDGTKFPVEVSLSTFEDNGELFVIAFTVDITERKKAEDELKKANDDLQQYTQEIKILNEDLEKKVEERTAELLESQKLYNTIARNFPNGIIAVLDKNLRYVFVEGKELYGLGLSRENVIGGRIFEFTAPDKTEEVENIIRKVFNNEKVAFEVEIGYSFYFVNGVPLTDIRGEITQALVVIENITEQKEAENSLMKALKKERELNEMKSRFVSLASHEFRTPLGTILSSLSLIEKYKTPDLEEKRLKHISRVKTSVQNLTHILDDFLSAGKLEEGEIQTTLVEFDIVKLAESIVQEMQTIAKEGQKIVFRATGKQELVYLDSQIVRNIFNNLLSNAIKYSPPEKNIYLTLKFNTSEVTIELKDYGMGIPVFEQEHLFERFFRASNVINTSGTGLGLSIVKRYLDLLKGRIEFQSQLDKGTTFTVHLPKSNL